MQQDDVLVVIQPWSVDACTHPSALEGFHVASREMESQESSQELDCTEYTLCMALRIG